MLLVTPGSGMQRSGNYHPVFPAPALHIHAQNQALLTRGAPEDFQFREAVCIRS